MVRLAQWPLLPGHLACGPAPTTFFPLPVRQTTGITQHGVRTDIRDAVETPQPETRPAASPSPSGKACALAAAAPLAWLQPPIPLWLRHNAAAGQHQTARKHNTPPPPCSHDSGLVYARQATLRSTTPFIARLRLYRRETATPRPETCPRA